MRRMKLVSVWTAAVAIAAMAAGCSGQAGRTDSDAAREGTRVAGQASDAIKDTGNATGEFAGNGPEITDLRPVL